MCGDATYGRRKVYIKIHRGAGVEGIGCGMSGTDRIAEYLFRAVRGFGGGAR